MDTSFTLRTVSFGNLMDTEDVVVSKLNPEGLVRKRSAETAEKIKAEKMKGLMVSSQLGMRVKSLR